METTKYGLFTGMTVEVSAVVSEAEPDQEEVDS
jgi:hypothetical protein